MGEDRRFFEYNEGKQTDRAGAQTPDTDPNQVNTGDVEMAIPQSKRSPAFQFYPESWFGSSKVSRMTHFERGLYMDLLSFAWLENGLPTNLKTLAAMVKIPPTRFERIWTDGPLHECFYEKSGRLFNRRQEIERRKQADHRKAKQDAAVIRWEKERGRDARAVQCSTAPHAPAMPSVSVSISDSVSISKKKEDGGKPPTPQLSELVDLWNTTVTPPLPQCVGLSPSRKGHINARLRERPLGEWKAIFQRINDTAFLRGENDRGWKASFDWIIGSADKALNVLEGKYDRSALAPTGTTGRGRTGAPPVGKYDGIEERG